MPKSGRRPADFRIPVAGGARARCSTQTPLPTWLTRRPSRRGGAGSTCHFSFRQIDQDRLHATVDILLLAQLELGEDRVAVLFYYSAREEESLGYRLVGAALRHQRENLTLTGRQR